MHHHHNHTIRMIIVIVTSIPMSRQCSMSAIANKAPEPLPTYEWKFER
jgi:hypothetical protein